MVTPDGKASVCFVGGVTMDIPLKLAMDLVIAFTQQKQGLQLDCAEVDLSFVPLHAHLTDAREAAATEPETPAAPAAPATPATPAPATVAPMPTHGRKLATASWADDVDAEEEAEKAAKAAAAEAAKPKNFADAVKASGSAPRAGVLVPIGRLRPIGSAVAKPPRKAEATPAVDSIQQTAAPGPHEGVCYNPECCTKFTLCPALNAARKWMRGCEDFRVDYVCQLPHGARTADGGYTLPTDLNHCTLGTRGLCKSDCNRNHPHPDWFTAIWRLMAKKDLALRNDFWLRSLYDTFGDDAIDFCGRVGIAIPEGWYYPTRVHATKAAEAAAEAAVAVVAAETPAKSPLPVGFAPADTKAKKAKKAAAPVVAAPVAAAVPVRAPTPPPEEEVVVKQKNGRQRKAQAKRDAKQAEVTAAPAAPVINDSLDFCAVEVSGFTDAPAIEQPVN